MPITQKEIQELKSIYNHENNVELSDRQAWDMAHRLVNLFHLLINDKPNESSSHIRKKIN